MKLLSTARLRAAALRSRLASSLWFLPTVVTILAVVAADVLGRIGNSPDSSERFFFTGGPDAARTILATITGSMITVTGLVFSLTVVALQVASGQFTPRLLRTFLADRGNQVVLSAFIATFAYSILLLRQVRDAGEQTMANVPGPGVSIAIVLTGICVALLVYFIHHLTNQLRVETVMRRVATATLMAIENTHPVDGEPTGGGLPRSPEDSLRLRAGSSGYLQSLDMDALFHVASRSGTNIRLRAWIGDYVAAGTTLAWAWPADDGDGREGPPEIDVDRLTQGCTTPSSWAGTARTTWTSRSGSVSSWTSRYVPCPPGVNDPTTSLWRA